MLQGYLDLWVAEDKRHYEAEPQDPKEQIRTRPRHLEMRFGRVKVA